MVSRRGFVRGHVSSSPAVKMTISQQLYLHCCPHCPHTVEHHSNPISWSVVIVPRFYTPSPGNQICHQVHKNGTSPSHCQIKASSSVLKIAAAAVITASMKWVSHYMVLIQFSDKHQSAIYSVRPIQKLNKTDKHSLLLPSFNSSTTAYPLFLWHPTMENPTFSLYNPVGIP